MARPRLGQFSFNPYQPEIDEDLQNELLAAAAAPNPMASVDESDAGAYGLDANDPEIMAAYMRLQNRKRDPAMYENPNAPVGARISDLLTGIGAVMQRRSPLQDIESAQSGRLAQQRRLQEQALGEEKLDISNLANLAKMRQAKSQLALRQQELAQRPEREKERLRQQFEQNLALQSAITGRQVDLQKARQQFEEGLKSEERTFKESQFEKEARLKRELEAMKQRGAGERQAQRGADKSGSTPNVVGYDVLEGAAPDKEDIKKVKSASVGWGRLDKALDALKQSVQKYGIRAVPGTEGARDIERAANNLVVEGKEAANLGALAGPDMQLVLGMIGNPRSLSAAFGGTGDYLQLLERARKDAWDKHTEEMRRRGFVPSGARSAPSSGETKDIGGVKYEKRTDGKWYPVQ